MAATTARWGKDKTCPICGAAFRSYNSITCSKKCMGERKRRLHGVTCVCGTCNVEFKMKKSEIEEGRGKYCSAKCYRNRPSTSFDANEVERLWGEGAAAGGIARYFGVAAQTISAFLKKRGLFEKRYRRGDNCRLWKGGVSLTQETVKRIKEHANHSCERCKWNQVPGVLQIHHRDRNRQHNTDDNLILLCPNCHEVDHYNSRTAKYTRHHRP